jgi:hypothetical protein
LKLTVLTPCASPKLFPEIVTRVPGLAAAGLTNEIDAVPIPIAVEPTHNEEALVLKATT